MHASTTICSLKKTPIQKKMPIFSLASSQTLALKCECRKLRYDRSMVFPGVCSGFSKKPFLSPTLALNLKPPKKERCLMIKSEMGDSPLQRGEEWVVNSGARMHFTPEIDDFVDFRNLKKPVEFWLPNGNRLWGSAIGDVAISPELTLKDVLYVGNEDRRTLSVGALMETSDDLIIALDIDGCSFVKRTSGQLLATGIRDVEGLYTITSPPRLANVGSPLILNPKPSEDKWTFRANRLVQRGVELPYKYIDPELVEWLIDSASINHWTCDFTILGNEAMYFDSAGKWRHSGDVSLLDVGVLLTNVHVDPSVDKNLLSVGDLCDTEDVAFHFVGDRCLMLDGSSGEQIAVAAKNEENLYVLKCWVLPV